jgi:hypothetical protein
MEDIRTIPRKYRNNKVIAMELVKIDGLAIKDIPSELAGDYDLVLNALSSNPLALKYTIDSIEQILYSGNYNDEQIIKLYSVICDCVRSDGMLLQYLCEELREDNLIVNTAITNNPDALQFASPKFLLNKKKFIKL